MPRADRDRQVEDAVKPMLARDEELRATGFAWGVEQRGQVPLLLRARDPYLVALTDHRLILFNPPRRRPLAEGDLVLAKRHSAFKVDKTRELPLFQVRLRTSDDRLLVLEFRRRHRSVGRRVVRAIAHSSAGAGP